MLDTVLQNWKQGLCALLLTLVVNVGVLAQNPVNPTTAKARTKAYQQRQQLQEQSVLQAMPVQSIGPTIMSGRITDLAVNPNNPNHILVAYASGGLWETKNNGHSFAPLFDQEAVMTIGDIAVNWQTSPPTIWLGSGENNSSRSSYAGHGIYKSTDGGKTWTNVGLQSSHHIGRIILHPTDSNTAWVAVLGRLYSPNKERGIYKTIDGGNTWQQTLFVNENTGGVDLIMDTNNANTLYAAMWERTRRAWNFVEAGSNSGIYKSTDGGENWTLISMAGSGFPNNGGVGRIGLAIHSNGVLYASLDNQNRRPDEDSEGEETAISKGDLRNMSRGAFLDLEEEKVADFLANNRFPKKYDAVSVTKMIKNNTITPNDLVLFLEDANSLLFDTPVIGAEVYKSTNSGKSWQKTHSDYLDDLMYSYGYYFGQIRVAPQNSDRIYILGVPILKSEDGGASFSSINGDNVHADHHALWINPQLDGHLINGNDGGLNISYDDGENWVKCNNPPVGQFYTVAVDNAEPFNVYGGLQDNGVWVGAHTYEQSKSWHEEGRYPYERLMGGDGMQIAIDQRNNDIVYTGYQFGNYYRINRATEDYTHIKPMHDLGERPLRFNWQTPIHLSVHQQDILYLGSNKLHRSFNQGSDFTAISNDLTKGGKKGDVPYGTLSSIHESPLQFGLLYTGSDDGYIHISKDGGNSWQRISDKLPQHLWVSRVQASTHKKERVYASLNGYRWDDFTAYLYQSDDYGKTWSSVKGNLPDEPINVVKEDPNNEHVLYVGTDHGLYISLDDGNSYQMVNELPAVAVHDIAIQAEGQKMAVGTHGRSIYLLDIQHIQQLTPEILSKDVHLFALDSQKHSPLWGSQYSQWQKTNTPSIDVALYTKQAGNYSCTITTADSLSVNLQTLVVAAKKGLNYFTYDLSVNELELPIFNTYLNAKAEEEASEDKITDPITLKPADNGKYYLPKGSYTIKLKPQNGGAAVTTEMVVE